MTTTIRLQREPFDVAAEVERMTHGRTDIGAVVTFTGLCRADENGRPIAALTLEHYPGMAEAEIGRHVEEAYARWPLLDVTVIHRFGRLEPGDVIVLVATASSHREAAFAAASFLMDYLKTRAPFWKQVESVGGKTGADKTGGQKTGGEKIWVEAKASDDTAAERWSAPPSARSREVARLFAQTQNISEDLLNLVFQKIRVRHVGRMIRAAAGRGNEML